MRVIGILTAFALLLPLAPAVAAADFDYFPLQVGNQWIYRISGFAPGVATVEIVKTGVFDGRTYFLLQGLPPGDAWLRKDAGGTLYAYNAAKQADDLWVPFTSPEGVTYSTSIYPCSASAAVSSRSARYTGPVGDFTWALLVAYKPGACADAGLEREFYLSSVGLLHRTETTIGGPRSYDLIYARLGGVTVVSAPEVTFSLTLDKAIYTTPQALARLNLRVVQDEPLALTFPSSQTYDLAIKDDKGQVIYTWSADKSFAMVLRQESIGPGEKNYPVALRLTTRDGKLLPPGHYTVEAWLTTMGSSPVYAATVGFEIR